MSSVEDDDDDNEKGLEDDPDAIETREEGQAKIRLLLQERQRKEDYMKRLEKKLRALDAELAERREKVENTQRTLEIERNKPKQEAESRKREKESKVHNQKERVRDLLGDVLYSKPKPKADAKEFELDTVQISFIRPGEQMRYPLAYRVDNNTAIRQLTSDVCKYWGVSDEEFILKTMNNCKCQNDILVKDCFKQGEIAQLLLVRKNMKNMIVAESELKAIQPKGQTKRKKAGGLKIDQDRVDAVGRMSSNFDAKLKEMAGIYMLLKLRDLKPSEHANKIKLRDILLFSILAILTYMSYESRRPASQEYFMVESVKSEMLPSRTDPDRGMSAPAFEDITTTEEVWQYLTVTMPLSLFSNSSVLRQYNSLMGYVQLRQQSVLFPATRTETCHANVKELMDPLQTLGSVGSPLRAPTCEGKEPAPSGMACDNLNPAGSPKINVQIQKVNRGTTYKISRDTAEKGESIDIDFDGPATITISRLEVGPGVLSLFKAQENGARFYITQKTINELGAGNMPDPIDVPPGKYNLQWSSANCTGPPGCVYEPVDPPRADQGWELKVAPTGPRCFPKDYTVETADTSTYESLKYYWNTRDPDEQGGLVRGPSNPGIFETAEKNKAERNMGTLTGYNQEYDASGHSVDFKLQVMDLYHGKIVVEQDIQKFKDLLWISIRTRLVVVSFSLYNFQYDKWVSVNMLFEMPPSGVVRPTYQIRPFKPTLEETEEEMSEVYIDYVRCTIALFIVLFIGSNERRHKEKNHKGGYQYLLSLNGISDGIIVVTILTTTIIRKVAFMVQKTQEWVDQLNGNPFGYISLSTEAYVFEQTAAVEGILFLATMARILSFLRLNHTVFMLWHTIGEGLKMFVYFCMLFLPIFLGFCILAHSIWAPYVDGFDTISETMLSLMEFMKGNLEFRSMGHSDTVWAAVFFILFFIIITFCLLNIFAAIMIDAYYVVQLTAGFNPAEYQWGVTKWLSWACPSLFFNFLMELTRPAQDTGG